MDISSALLVVLAGVVASYIIGMALSGAIIGRAIILTNDITERLSFILGITYKIVGVVLVVYFITPDSLIREMFVNGMSVAFYVLYRLDIDALESIDNRDLDA